MSEHRRHPYSAAALNAPPPTKKRPSLSSPLPPSPIVPSTPLPKSKNQPAYQQRPSTAASTSSANLSDSPSTCTRGMMKRLLAKPAPPSVALVPSSPSMRSNHPKYNKEDQDPVPEIIISALPPRIDSLPSSQSSNDFDKSIRALDLVGQIEISMTPTETYTTRESVEINPNSEPTADDSAKRHRHLLRRRPSATTKITTIYLPSSSSGSFFFFFFTATPFHFLYYSFIEPSYEGSTTPTPSTLTPPRSLPIRLLPQTSSPTRHPIQRNTSFDDSSPIHSSDIQVPNPNPPESVTPYYTVAGDTSAAIAPSGSLGDSFWETHGEYVSSDKRQNEDGSDAFTRVLTRTISGRRKKNDSLRSEASLPESNKAPIDSGAVKTSHVSPAGSTGNQSRRLWKLMRKISGSTIREKTQLNPVPPPPVPPLPSDVNTPVRRTRHTSHPSDSSLKAEDSGIKQSISASSPPMLELSPTTPLDEVDVIAVASSVSAQPQSPYPTPQPATGPRPSTTACSSSPSPDVASSRSYPVNRPQSPRSSTSSFVEEMVALPSLSTTLIPTSNASNETDTNDTSAGPKLQQHIIPPNELSRHHSISKFLTNTPTIDPVSIQPLSSPMEDDWTIVRSPSVELESLPLPPPPRQVLKGVGRNVAGGDQGYKQSRTKAKANLVIPTSKTLKTINSSEEMDKKSLDAATSAPSDGRTEKKSTMETGNLQQGGQELETERSNAEPDSDQSPTIPSFSTTSAINSFPDRPLSSSLSAASRSRGSPIALSPTRSSKSSGASSRLASSSPLLSTPRTPERHESRSTLGRVRQHLFGANSDRPKVAENNVPLPRKSDVQIAHLQQLYSPLHPPPEYRTKSRRHHRHSSGGATSISSPRATHTPAVSVSMPASPITPHPHRRSMSFHTSLPSLGLFTSAGSPPKSLPPPPISPSMSPISSTSLAAVSTPQLTAPLSLVRSRTPSRSGISGKKLSGVSSSSSASPSTSPEPNSASASRRRGRSSSTSGHRTIGALMSRSITVGVNKYSNSNTFTPMTPSPPRTQLTDQEKADKWNDLLARSARAGGTLHLAVGGGLLGSDDI